MNQLIPIILTALLTSHSLSRSNDPFVKKPTKNALPPEQSSIENFKRNNFATDIEVIQQTFSLPKNTASELLRKNLSGKALHSTILELLKKKEAKQKDLLVVRARPHQTTTAEEITEFIYPTGYEIFKTPKNKKDRPVDADQFGSKFAIPVNFDTKNLGITLEVRAAYSRTQNFLPLTPKGVEILKKYQAQSTNWNSDDQETTKIISKATKDGDITLRRQIDLDFLLRHCFLKNFKQWGAAELNASMPNFDVKRVVVSASLTENEPRLMGTISPPTTNLNKQSEEEIWLVFATARLKTISD